MVTTLLVRRIPGTGGEEQADAIAEDVQRRIDRRIATLKCPNDHDPALTPGGCIIIRADSPEYFGLENSGVCCKDYYELLKAI